MNTESDMSRLDEYYVIRVERRSASGPPARHELFIGNRLGLTRKQPRHFATLDDAEDHLDELGEQSRYRFIIQFCTRGKQTEQPDELGKLINRIMEIPHPYRRTAYNWLRGRDVKALLMRESAEVYTRHRDMLRDHDLDITRPSQIVLLKPKRRKKFVFHSADDGNRPRQYFAYPDQRPDSDKS